MTEAEYEEKTSAARLSYEAATLALLFAHAEDPQRSLDEARDRGWEMLQELVVVTPPQTSPNKTREAS